MTIITTFLTDGVYIPGPGITSIEVLVVAGGGGGGGKNIGGGGGGGGLIYDASYSVVPGTPINIVVGAGGSGGLNDDGTEDHYGTNGANGGNSSFGSLIAIGGGGGGHGVPPNGNPDGISDGESGGSGGGGGGIDLAPLSSGGSATSGQGTAGADGEGGFGNPNPQGGGGGGAGTPGNSKDGGDGLEYSISGTPVYYAGGGGGGTNWSASSGGDGGGGAGGSGTPPTGGTDGIANTGGGGGGAGGHDPSASEGGGAGGSGIVIISSGDSVALNDIFGIQILTGKTIASMSEIGLYATAGGSEFRFSEAPVAGLAEEWATGFLSKKIGKVSFKADSSRGGGLISLNIGSIEISDANQFALRCKELGIRFNGYRVIIHEFIGTDADSDSSERSVFCTGVIGEPVWDEYTLTLPIQGAQYKRRANLGKAIDAEKIYPVTFGTHAFAKFLRLSDSQIRFNLTDFYTAPGTPPTPENTMIFPVILAEATVPPRQYQIELGLTCDDDTATALIDYIKTYQPYAKVVTDPNYAGYYRRILSATDVGGTPHVIVVLFDAFFPGTLNVAAGTRAWIELYSMDFQYVADFWNCIGCTDDAGTVLERGAWLYEYEANSALASIIENGDFKRIPQHGYDVDSVDTTKTLLTIDPKHFNDDPNNLDSFLILPIQDAELEDSDPCVWRSALEKKANGVYSTELAHQEDITINYLSYINDKDLTTQAAISGTVAITSEISYVLKFKLPVLPVGFDFSSTNIYILIKILDGASLPPNIDSYVSLLYRLYKDPAINFGPSGAGIGLSPTTNNFPGFYTGETVIAGDSYFYVDGATNPGGAGGYKTFKLTGIDSIEKYNSIYELGLVLERVKDSGVWPEFEEDIDIYEIAVCFAKTASIKDVLYSPFKGRIFDDTWGTRKTAADLITTPVDIIEHIKRLQRGTEDGISEPAVGVPWGQAYWPNAPIKTGAATGSFDSTILGAEGSSDPFDANYDLVWLPKDLTVTRQIIDKASAFTDTLIKSLCNAFYLFSYQNRDSDECLAYLLDKTAPTTTITFADIFPGSISEIQEPKTEDLFLEPILKYNYDPGSGKYLSQLAITNVDADTYDSSFATGFTTALHGEIVWNYYHDLFVKFSHIEQEQPTPQTEMPWITDYKTAVWRIAAQAKWIDRYRFSFKVLWDTGRLWEFGTRLNINLPFETNSYPVPVIIEGIDLDKSSGNVTVSVALDPDEIPEGLSIERIQDTFDDETNIQDTDETGEAHEQDVY